MERDFIMWQEPEIPSVKWPEGLETK